VHSELLPWEPPLGGEVKLMLPTTAVKGGKRGTANFAKPDRAAHQLAETAMAKAKVAV